MIEVTEDIVAASSLIDKYNPDKWIKSPLSLRVRLGFLWNAIVWFLEWAILNSPIATHDSEAINSWYFTKEPRNPVWNAHFQSATSSFDTFLRGYWWSIPD